MWRKIIIIIIIIKCIYNGEKYIYSYIHFFIYIGKIFEITI